MVKVSLAAFRETSLPPSSLMVRFQDSGIQQDGGFFTGLAHDVAQFWIR